MAPEPCQRCGGPFCPSDYCLTDGAPSWGWSWVAIVALLVSLLVVAALAPGEPLLAAPTPEGRP
jgi:hypothetical protein